MKRTILILFVVLSMGSLCAFKGHQQTNQAPAQDQLVTIDLNQQDVRVALRGLFKSHDISYTIAPDVLGTVTANFHSMKFEDVVPNLLRQVDATYRVEAGVYEIVRRDSTPVVAGEPEVDVRTAAAITIEGKYVYIVLDHTAYKLTKSDMKVVSKTPLP